MLSCASESGGEGGREREPARQRARGHRQRKVSGNTFQARVPRSRSSPLDVLMHVENNLTANLLHSFSFLVSCARRAHGAPKAREGWTMCAEVLFLSRSFSTGVPSGHIRAVSLSPSICSSRPLAFYY